MKYHVELGNICRSFRVETLNITLKQMSTLTDEKLTTISAFENGRTTNFNRLFIYLELCTDDEKEKLIEEVNKLLRGQ